MERQEEEKERISLEFDHEIRYWMQRFQCTKEQLVKAVRKAGVCVKAVSRELAR